MLFAGEFEGVTQRRCDPCEIDKEVVASVEDVGSLMPAVCGCDKYAGVAPGTERDVGGEAGAAPGFLNDRGWIVRRIEVYPA